MDNTHTLKGWTLLPQMVWAACSSALPASQERISSWPLIEISALSLNCFSLCYHCVLLSKIVLTQVRYLLHFFSCRTLLNLVRFTWALTLFIKFSCVSQGAGPFPSFFWWHFKTWAKIALHICWTYLTLALSVTQSEKLWQWDVLKRKKKKAASHHSQLKHLAFHLFQWPIQVRMCLSLDFGKQKINI